MRRSIAPFSTSAASYLRPSSVAFITNITESSFQHTEATTRTVRVQSTLKFNDYPPLRMVQRGRGWGQFRFPEWWAKLSSMDKRSGQRPGLVVSQPREDNHGTANQHHRKRFRGAHHQC